MKRILALALALLLTVNMLTPSAFCKEQERGNLNINSSLLDAMLYGSRHWVVETLVEDSRTNNPMAIVQGRGGQKSLARDAIDRYNGVDAKGTTKESIYKSMVWTMEKIYNADEYVSGWMDEAGNLIGAALELFTGADDLKKTLDDVTTSTDQLRYDRLLKAVLMEEYTASSGVKAGISESNLIFTRQAKDAAQYFNSFIHLVNTDIDTLVGMENAENFTLEYVTKYAAPYYDAVEQMLQSIEALTGDAGSTELEIKMELLSALSALEAYSVLKPQPTFSGFSYQEYLAEFMVESGVKSLFQSVGKVLDIHETSLDSYLYVNSLQRQRETTIGPLQRIAESTKNEDMRSSLDYAIRMMDKSYQNEMFNYDAIVRYLRSEEVANKTMAKLAKSALKKCGFLTENSLGGAVIAKATPIIKITEVVADKAVGLKDTCKKTYELLYLERFIDAAVAQYKSDVADYEKSRSEDAAGLVLDDLLLLQRLRLYGEKVAYGLWSAQATSWIGRLFSDGFDPKSYDWVYQGSIDELICASVMPMIEGLTVQPGEICTIQYSEKAGYYALIKPQTPESTGRDCVDVETASRLAIGVEASGKLVAQARAAQQLHLGYLNTSGSAMVGVLNGAMRIDELTQAGGELTLVTNLGGSFACNRMAVSKCEYAPKDGARLAVGDLSVSGTLTGGAATVSGTLSGNGSISSALTLNGAQPQRVNGTLSVADLTLSGPRVVVDGGLTVTDTLCGGTTEVVRGKNIVLSGGKLLGDSFRGALSTKNAMLSNQKVEGILYNQGGLRCAGSVSLGGLVSSGTLSIAERGVMSVNGNIRFRTGGTVSGGRIAAKSDIIAEGETKLARLDLNSRGKQTLQGSIVVDELHIDCLGAEMQGQLSVQKLLDYQAGTLTGKAVSLADGAVIKNDRYNGALSLLNWTPEQKGRIVGSLTIRDGGSITGDADITGTLTAAGSAVIDGRVSAGALKSASSLTMKDASALTVLGSTSLGGTVTGGTLTVCEDMHANGLTASGEISVGGDLSVSGKTSFAVLRLDGKLPQKVMGSDFTVDRLELSNTSGRPLDVQQTITVMEKLTNNSVSVRKGAIRSAVLDVPADGNAVYPGDLTLNSDRTLTGGHVVIQGDLYLNGGTISLAGASLEVRGKLVASGASLALDKDSRVYVAGRAMLTNVPVTLDGTLTVQDDLILSSSAISGGGTLDLRGDLFSGSAITVGTLRLDGLTRQYLNSSAKVLAEKVVFKNPSRGGVVLQSVINYKQGVELNGTSVFGGGKLKEAA